MIVVLTLVLLLAGGGALALWLSRRLADQSAQTAHVLDQLLATRNTEVDGRLQAITATMDRRLGELDTKVDRRLEHAAKQTNAIHRQLVTPTRHFGDTPRDRGRGDPAALHVMSLVGRNRSVNNLS